MPQHYFIQFLNKISISNICIEELFGGLLNWENGSGFLLQGANIPDYSVTIVRLNHDLVSYLDSNNRLYFRGTHNGETFKVKYVGVSDLSHPTCINAGSLIRFSLARWWDRNGNLDVKRAYLQLSAVY